MREQMHKWSEEKLSKYHPWIKPFGNFLRMFCEHNNDVVTSSYDIQLPFKVQKDIQLLKRYGGSDGSAILYIDVVSDERDDYNNEHKKSI